MKQEISLLQQTAPVLLAWYGANRREMPWRSEPTPYHVWISEIMLQQTRIEAVMPYYRRFLRAVPTVDALAALPDDELMKLWEGLGYYSRARNLKKAAQRIVTEYGGKLPQEAENLRKLPGIGEYTAGAIASIAYGQPEPAVDGNVLRVIMRLTAREDDIAKEKTKRTVADALRAVYPSGENASALTQAWMELGEVICLPNGAPKCAECPLRAMCRARLADAVERYPVKSPKKERKIVQKTVFLLSCGERYAVRKREDCGLLAGLWEFPNAEGFLGEAESAAFLTAHGLTAERLVPCGQSRHIFTHVEWEMAGVRAECGQTCASFAWKTAEEIARDCALPTAFRFFARQILPRRK